MKHTKIYLLIGILTTALQGWDILFILLTLIFVLTFGFNK